MTYTIDETVNSMSLGIMCRYHYIHVCTTMLGQSGHSEILAT